jgi:predicted regulator of Ras-like GTPase activity (Roadblock/LC7/MglB family)
VDAAQALADLTEISSQIEAAVLFLESGQTIASTLVDDDRTRELVRSAAQLLEAAQGLPAEAPLTQLEASTHDGSVFVVVDGERRIVATTAHNPTVGLVFYDLKSCLRAAEPEKRAARRKKREEVDDDAA